MQLSDVKKYPFGNQLVFFWEGGKRWGEKGETGPHQADSRRCGALCRRGRGPFGQVAVCLAAELSPVPRERPGEKPQRVLSTAQFESFPWFIVNS